MPIENIKAVLFWPELFSFQPLVKFKSHLYFEEKDYVTEAEKKLKPQTGSQVGTDWK